MSERKFQAATVEATAADPTTPGPWRAVVTSRRIEGVVAEARASEDPTSVAARFWEAVSATPLWEPDPDYPGAWRVTFLWRGDPQSTRHVNLCGGIVFSEFNGIPLNHVPDTDIWHLTLRVPPRTRSEYQLAPNGLLRPPESHEDVGRVQKTWVPDPRNKIAVVLPKNTALPELTPATSSLLEAPDATPLKWIVPQAKSPTGELEEHIFRSDELKGERRIWSYTPARWEPTEEACPLLVACDGWFGVNVMQLPVVLDNLIASGLIPPVVAVLVDSGTLAMRTLDLDCHEPYSKFLTDEIVPWANERWNRRPDRSQTLVAGVSLGGKAALSAALRRPEVFGKVIAQSAAVSEAEDSVVAGFRAADAVRDQAAGDTTPRQSRDVLRDIAAIPIASRSEQLDIFLDVGLLEIDLHGSWGFLPGVRQLRDTLRDAGHVVYYTEIACGHDGIVSGENIADALQLLLNE